MTQVQAAVCQACGSAFSPVAEDDTVCPDCRRAAQPTMVRRRLTWAELAARFPVTFGIIAINVLVFAAMVARGVSPASPSVEQLQHWGANFGPLTLGDQPWRLLTSCFVHGGALHLALNMWAFWFLGLFVERSLGRVRFAIAYLVAGLGGAVASVWWHPLTTSIGASGAIFGMAGMLLTLSWFGKLSGLAQHLKHTSKSILAFVIYNLAFGFIDTRIDNSAHIGGLITGLVLGAVLPVAHPDEDGLRVRDVVVFGIAGALLFGVFTYARRGNAAMLAWYRGDQQMQSGHYEAAESDLRHALALKPDLGDAQRSLAYVYLKKKAYADAADAANKAIKLGDDDAFCYQTLGLAYLGLGRPQDAEAALKNVVQADPRDPTAWYNLGLALREQAKWPQAAQAFQRALQLNPKDEEARARLYEAQRFRELTPQ